MIMERKEIKKEHISVCRLCGGSGRIITARGEDGEALREACPQCGGSGRVLVSAEITYRIRPYRPRTKD